MIPCGRGGGGAPGDPHSVPGAEIGRSLAHAMRQTYTEIVGDLACGVKPVGLQVRQSPHDAGFAWPAAPPACKVI